MYINSLMTRSYQHIPQLHQTRISTSHKSMYIFVYLPMVMLYLGQKARDDLIHGGSKPRPLRTLTNHMSRSNSDNNSGDFISKRLLRGG